MDDHSDSSNLFHSLHELYLKTSELKVQMLKGEISLINEDLKSIFNELQQNIQPSELETAVLIMDDGTVMLEKKLEEINRFIYNLIEKDSILNYLKKSSDDQLADNLKAFWQFPFKIHHFSIKFLQESWSRLIGNRHPRTRNQIPQITDINTEQLTDFISNANEPFEEQMHAFYSSIYSKLPCNVSDLFSMVQSIDQYFEYFSYFLHLLHNGLLIYDKENQTVRASHE
jgi:hypothetical protein